MALADHAARLKLALSLKVRDPLSFWHFGVPRLRDALNLFTAPDPIDECYLRGPNKGTKTETCAAFVTACLQGRKVLDGVALPHWRGPVEALCGVLDYKQQLLSVQPAYLRVLGQHPHHARYSGEILQSLRVRKEDSTDDEATWSVIHFASQENKRAGLGARADIVHFDEPPVMEILRELRKASHAGRASIRLIGATPTLRRQWAPLKLEYGDAPRSRLTRIDVDTAECRWSLAEVADWILSPAEKARLQRRYATDPLAAAREHGDYTTAEGANPLNVGALQAMLAACRPPLATIEWDVTREVPEREGLVRRSAVAVVKVWAYAKPGERFYIPVDPSQGINDPLHDPGALHVRRVGDGALVATHNGYLGAYGLGVLAAGLARQYNNAKVDVERNGGWGEGTLRGLADAKYGNIARERLWDRAESKWKDELGWRTNQDNRRGMFSLLRQWTDDYAAGNEYAPCPSAEVIETLLDLVIDEDGKPVAAPGYHDEHAILLGQGHRRLLRGTGTEVREPESPLKRADDELVALINGAVEEPEGRARPRHGILLPRGYR